LRCAIIAFASSASGSARRLFPLNRYSNFINALNPWVSKKIYSFGGVYGGYYITMLFNN
jgi:hypothetical protein